MQRKLLAATVAAGPLLALALGAPSAALAQTTITTATTVPVATATANAGAPSDVVLDVAGTITLPGAGPAITLNSNNNVTVSGVISTKDVSDSTGVLAIGGNTGNITVGSNINMLSDYQPTDNDNDGDADGAFATGSNRFGVRVTGPAPFNGNINVIAGGAIAAVGADSAGVSIETALNGNVTISGTATVVGDRVYGIHATGPISGPVRIAGSVSATGLGATGVALDGDLGNSLVFQGAVTATGFRYTSRPPLDTQRAMLEADDKLLGGPGIRIGGNVAGGILFDIAPVLDTTDANADGIPDNPDVDGDGIADLAEGSSTVSVFGSAPAVLVGGTTAATSVGLVAGAPYGFYNKGSISADGVLDGFAATAVQIGRGQAVNIAGGVGNTGSVSATSYLANSTALGLSGVTTPTIYNAGSYVASTTSDGAHTARAVSIQADSTVSSLTNLGTISAAVAGAKGDAIAFEDLGGGVRAVENSGRITAAVTGTPGVATTGKAIALDLRAATGDVTVHQDHAPSATVSPENDSDKDGINDVDEPLIFGDVLFGAGNDRLLLANGSLTGAMSFGAGADLLSISGGATATGALTDSDGRLDIDVSNGTLSITNAAIINATSLNVGANSGLRFTADPAHDTATRIVVGSANLAPGAKVDMTLASILDTPTRYTVIQAGTLNVGNLSSTLSGSPYLYVSSASSNAALGEVYVDVRPKTAQELGFNRSETQAYSAIVEALKKDTELAAPLLAQTSSEGLNRLYDQLMPEQGQGLFDALAYSNAQLSQAVSQKPDLFDRYGPDSVWVHEVNTLVRQKSDENTIGSDTQVFGFTGGYEAMGEYGGALGVALSYMNVQERDNAAQVGERTTASFVQGMGYWRRSIGGLQVAAGGGGGYGWIEADRRFFSGDLNADGTNDLARENSADWNGLLGQAFTSVAYEQTFGRYYLRPEGRLDYVYLREGARKGTGGGAGFDLNVAKRSSSSLDGLAAMTFGATFGHDLWWRPEVRVGYRQRLAGSMGDTVANFAGGDPFSLTAENQKDGAITFDMALRAGTPMSYVAVEGGVAAAKRTKRYNLRLAGRMMF